MKELHSYDFDGTLINTPTPEYGIYDWEEKTGKIYKHQGWWSKKESLDIDIFDITKNNIVYNEYLKSISNDDAYTIMMSGRIKYLENEVKKILNIHNMTFDKYYFNLGGPTLRYKIRVFEYYIKKFPDLEKIIMYDDRNEHIPEFVKWAKICSNKYNVKFDIIHVGDEYIKMIYKIPFKKF